MPDPNVLARGVAAGDRRALARAITLLESRRPDRAALGQAVLERLLPGCGKALRVGITGVPGVGKSTAIEALGMRLVGRGRKVAVLAVDPSSERSGGSILGDKTRMPTLAATAAAYIRPSPSAGTLGGVARRTRETMLLCEAAGFDVIFVETVGVGQSETMVAGMVDCFLVLVLPGAGDELQGIKKGIIELADLIAVTKADGGNHLAAKQAVRHYRNALHIITDREAPWQPRVLAISAADGTGLDELWQAVEAHRAALESTGALEEKRRHQALRWFESLLDERLRALFLEIRGLRRVIRDAEAAVAAGTTTPGAAVDRVLSELGARLAETAAGP